jgi:hypothetical protein
VAIQYGEAVTAPALIALFRQIIANDRVGGWRELSDIQMGGGRTSDSAVFRAGHRPDERREPVPVHIAGSAGWSCPDDPAPALTGEQQRALAQISEAITARADAPTP